MSKPNHLKKNTNIELIEQNERKPNTDILLISLLEDFCYLYDYNRTKSSTIFLKICQKLDKMGIVSSESYMENTKPLRNLYRKMLGQLINNIKYNVIEDGYVKNDIKDDTIDKNITSENPLELINYIQNNQSSDEESAVNNVAVKTMIKSYSRLHQDFIQLENIGKGGFGKVFKVYHKMDSSIYALKKIPVKNCDSKSISLGKTLIEVRCIAKLNHPNVIRYYNSWIEYDYNDSKEEDSDLNSSNLDLNSSNLDLNSSNSSNQSNNIVNDLQLTLFIQMELCDLNLKDWLIKRDEFEDFNYEYSQSIFKQIVLGLNHIHSNNMIHRDIKPANIFLFNIYKDSFVPDDKIDSFNYIIKIADFGLSKEKIRSKSDNECMYRIENDEMEDVENNKNSLKKSTSYNNIIKSASISYDTTNLGTQSYASPEQLNSYNYDNKTDCYSLGIILFELFYINKTLMERYINIKNLRESKILPKDFNPEYKKEKQLILELVNNNSIMRPDIRNILEKYFINYNL
jgi:eukaryotic translation initiation factor 2-alpha kinase 1